MKKRALFIGLTTIDIQYFVEEFPKPDIKIKSAPPEILVGGPATNAAVAFSFLGGQAYLASPVGVNSLSYLVQDDFSKTGITHLDLAGKRSFHPVLATVITSEKDGGRNIFTHNPEDLMPEMDASQILNISDPDIIMADGFYPGISLNVIKLAKAQGIPIVLDCGSWKPQFHSLLPLADYAACSHDFLPPGCSDSIEVLKFLDKNGVPNAAITRGENSILWQNKGQFGEIPVTKTTVSDTLGAGDFFHGALTFYLLSDFDFDVSLSKASALATQTCRYPGTRNWINFVKQVR